LFYTSWIIQNNTAPHVLDQTHKFDNDRSLAVFAVVAYDDEGDHLNITFTKLPHRGDLYYRTYAPENLVTYNSFFNENQTVFVYARYNTSIFNWGDDYDSLSYCVEDSEYRECANVTIDIRLRNLPPLPTQPFNYEVEVDEDSMIYLELNATDVDGPYSQIVYNITSLPEHGTLLRESVDLHGNPANYTVIAGNPREAFEYMWNYLYVPPPNFYTTNDEPEEIHYVVCDFFDCYPDEFVIRIFVNPVNDPPQIVGHDDPYVYMYWYNRALFFAGLLTNVTIEDDAAPGTELTLTTYCLGCEPAISAFYFVDNSSFTNFNWTLDDYGTYTIVANGTLAGINIALASGLRFDPVGQGEYNVPEAIWLEINDNGNTGTGGDLNATRIFGVIEEETSSIHPPGAGPAIVGMVGITSLVSLGLFGAYKLMKKKNLIPEEADPWENDSLWDATVDNPLFSAEPPPMMESL